MATTRVMTSSARTRFSGDELEALLLENEIINVGTERCASARRVARATCSHSLRWRRAFAMLPDVHVLHGGDIAREVANGLAASLESFSRPTKVFAMADYVTSGFDIVDVSEEGTDAIPETSSSSTRAYVLVVETSEFENPADGAVTFLRDLLAADKKTKTTPKRWEVRSVVGEGWSSSGPRGESSDDTSRETSNARSTMRYAVIAVGDTDVMAERAAFRSKQNSASDCNQAGQLCDRLLKNRGGEKICARLEIDVSRDLVESQTETWVRDVFLPVLRDDTCTERALTNEL